MKLHYLLILTMINVEEVEVLRFSFANCRKFMRGISQMDADPTRLDFKVLCLVILSIVSFDCIGQRKAGLLSSHPFNVITEFYFSV